jgi:hypothetical protein
MIRFPPFAAPLEGWTNAIAVDPSQAFLLCKHGGQVAELPPPPGAPQVPHLVLFTTMAAAKDYAALVQIDTLNLTPVSIAVLERAAREGKGVLVNPRRGKDHPLAWALLNALLPIEGQA